MENDNQPADPEMESSSSSLSFVLAEEIDAISQLQNDQATGGAAVEVGIDSLAVMTRSQYAQVLFEDVADSYPNDTDIVCSLVLSDEASPAAAATTVDQVGIFRVPFVEPTAVLATRDVTTGDVTNGRGSVVFTADQVPKVEDFYQFQYLRPASGQTHVLGASIPFQLTKPKTEELCAVQESGSEFMMVKTATAVASGQLSDKIGNLQNEKDQLKMSLNRTTTDYSKLLKMSEELTEQLEEKQLANIELEKNLQTARYDFAQLKNDVAILVQDKVILEQRLHKSHESIKTLTTDKDSLVGQLSAKERENVLLREERDKLSSKLEDTKAMMMALSDSKVMANKMIAEHVERERAMEGEMQKLRDFAAGKAQEQTKRVELEKQQSNQENGSKKEYIGPAPEENGERLSSLEKRVQELQTLVRNMDGEHMEKFQSLNRDMDSLRSAVSQAGSTSSQLDSVASSVELLKSDLIGLKLRERGALRAECRNESDASPRPMARATDTASTTSNPTPTGSQTPACSSAAASIPDPRSPTFWSQSGVAALPAWGPSPVPPPPSAPTPGSSPEESLPIPVLPVQTVEAMAAAAKGSVQSIKQLLTSLQGSFDSKEKDEGSFMPVGPSIEATLPLDVVYGQPVAPKVPLSSGAPSTSLPNEARASDSGKVSAPVKAENAWKPGQMASGGQEAKEDPLAEVSKQTLAILNELTPQTSDKLLSKLTKINIDTESKLRKCMELIFEKAVNEPGFAVECAKMGKICHQFSVEDPRTNKVISFRKLLITRCQTEFQKDYMEGIDPEKLKKQIEKAETEDEKKKLQEEFKNKEKKARRRFSGNILLIGELYKLEMLSVRIMHEIIRGLLNKQDEQSLECLCTLVSSIGKVLEEDTAARIQIVQKRNGPRQAKVVNLDFYFNQMQSIVDQKQASSRIRCLLLDLIELRVNKWVPRRKVASLKTIDQGQAAAQSEDSPAPTDNVVAVTLSDDGRPIEVSQDEGETQLKCPMCPKTFGPDCIQNLQFHVEEHMKTSLVCPVCEARYDVDMQQPFEYHVTSHFRDEEEQQPEETRRESSFWFLDP